MLSPTRILRRLHALFTTRRLDDELDEEMRFHLEMETAKLINAGMDKRTAAETARREFGGVGRHRDAARDARGVRPVEDLLQDLRVGARTIAKQPTYAAVAILTLAIGIGATTALGTAVYRVLLQPYPYAEADRIVALFQTDTRAGSTRQAVASGNFLDWRARARAFDLMAAAEPYSFDWIGPAGPERFGAALVTEDWFPIQGLRPVLGRAFMKEEFVAGRDNVVLMTESLWRTRFGSDSSLIGRSLVLDSVARIVVGVMPEVAFEPYGANFWAPKIIRPDEPTTRVGGYWTVVGRLAPGVSQLRGQVELDGIARQLAAEHPPTNRNTGAMVVMLREAVTGSVRRSLLVLFGAVAFVLLIACVNVANLQLAESIRRQREMAIRTAIGAGHGRLVRQLLAESMLVAIAGAAAGLGLAHAGIGAIRAAAPSGIWQLERLSLDTPALLLALGLAVVSATVVSLMPVLAVGRIRLAEALAAGGRGSSAGRVRRRANRFLVVSEVALALVLLVGAGLLLRSLGMLVQTDRGFRTDGVLVTTLQAWSYYPTPAQRAEFVRQAMTRLETLPGVERAAMTSSLPLSWPIGREGAGVDIEGYSVAPGDEQPTVRVTATGGDYFGALGIRVQAGRSFNDTDIASSPQVAVVNRAFVRRYYPNGDALGKRVRLGFMSPPVSREIVGIVGDVRHSGLHADPVPSIFVPHAQAPTGAMHLITLTSGDAGLLQRAVREELSAMNGAMPLTEMTTMDALLSASLRERRFQLGLLSAFSLTALLLSAIGIYGVMNRATGERTHEIGVRMAVGAQRADVRWMVLRSGGGLAAVGIVVGLAIAVALTRYMSGMLFGVRPLDPVTYGVAAAVLLLAGVLATWLPAWRASSVDPVEALRND